MSRPPLRLGTRGSALALAQAHIVAGLLEAAGTRVELVTIETAGDRRRPDTAWGEGAFVAAIEQALRGGRVDAAVHSAKDVPTEETADLVVAAFLEREDPRDALVVRAGDPAHDLTSLPRGTRVGTDSPRRTGFLLARRPDLRMHPLHGNVDTRLRRLDEGETDVLVLAAAGLRRLGRGDRIGAFLEPVLVPPAPGQGAIAVQVRTDDIASRAAVAALDHHPTRMAVEAERAFLAATGGGCRAPIGALATVTGERLELIGGWAAPDGSARTFGREEGAVADRLALGRALAALVGPRWRILVTRAVEGADELLDALRASGLRPVHVPAIAIEPVAAGSELDLAAARLGRYDWVVVTSANGARAVVTAAERGGSALDSARWASVGAATSESLEAAGVDVAFQPARASGAGLAAELPVRVGERVLLARADIADGWLPDALRARGARVEEVVAYRTREAPPPSRALLRDALDGDRIDAVLFTSGSTVRGLLSLAGRGRAADVTAIPAVCLGPETAEAARLAGFTILATAPAQEVAALAARTAAALDAADRHDGRDGHRQEETP